MFLGSIGKMGSMSEKYSSTHNPNSLPAQHRRYRVSPEAKGEIDNQLKEMTVPDIITPQVELTTLVSSLTHPCKRDGILRVCLDPKDLNKAIICEHHKATILEEITHKLAGATTNYYY